jgi:uncharacterized membrane protein
MKEGRMLPFIWFASVAVTATVAHSKGRNVIGWLFIGCITGVFGLIALLFMKNLEA